MKKRFFNRFMATLCSIMMVVSILPIEAYAAVPDPLPEGVNPGYSITDSASLTAAQSNSWLGNGGTAVWVADPEDAGNSVLQLTANPANTERHHWDWDFTAKEALSVGGTYEVSYKIFVPEDSKGELKAQFMKNGDWGKELPKDGGVAITKGEWVTVQDTFPVVTAEFSMISLILQGSVADLPDMWYMDDINITLVDYAGDDTEEPGGGETTPDLEDPELMENIPAGVNPGFVMTDNASFTEARGNSWVNNGTELWVADPDDATNSILRLTANSTNNSDHQWDWQFTAKTPLSVGGTYAVSYKLFVPVDEKGPLKAYAMLGDWGEPRLPNDGVDVTKGQWITVRATLPVITKEMADDGYTNKVWFLFRDTPIANFPDVRYMDDIKVILTDYKAPSVEEPEETGPMQEVFITFDEAVDKAKIKPNTTWVADDGTDTWVTGADVGYNNDGNMLKCTYDSSKYDASWKGAYNFKLVDKLSVNGTYKVSYWVYIPSAGNETKTTLAKAGFVIDNGFGNGAGVSEFPVSSVTMEKDKWIKVEAELPKRARATDQFALRFSGTPETFPNVYYVDQFKVELVDFDETPPVIPGWEAETASLKDTFASDFLMGNILQAGAFTDEESEQTKAEFLKQYNTITLENAMKPDQLSKAKDTYDYTEADSMVDWARAQGLDVHGHVLVWHSQSPAWLNKGLTRAEAKVNMENYIKEVTAHFDGKLISWDVVNEAFTNDALDSNGKNVTDWREGLRNNGIPGDPAGSDWYKAYENGMDAEAGEHPSDYIYDAFVLAREYAPNVKLYYNDFNDDVPNKVKAICNMITDLNGRWANDARNTEPNRLLIEGMGLQSHYSTTYTNDTTGVRKALEAYIATGVEVAVSELDVSIENTANDLNTVENQCRIYKNLFKIYTSPGIIEHLSRVTFWGMHDGVSWRGAKNCLPFDLNQKAKPVFADIIAIGTGQDTSPEEPPITPTVTPTVTPTATPTPTPTVMPAEKLAAPTGVKVTNSSANSLKISWKKVSGAAKYEVYSATKKGGKYKKIATTTSASYTHKKLKNKKTYYYKVRACATVNKATSYSDYTKVFSKKVALAKPAVTAKAKSKSAIKLSWKKVGGAKKYEIYVATSKKGKYKKIATTKSLTYTHKKLEKNTKYYYKVKAVQVISKKTYKSAYSTVTNAKTAKK